MCPAPLVGLQEYQHLFLESILKDLPMALLQVASIHCKIMIKDITCKPVAVIYCQVLCSVPCVPRFRVAGSAVLLFPLALPPASCIALESHWAAGSFLPCAGPL